MDRIENRIFDLFQKRIDDDLAESGKSKKEKFHEVNDDLASRFGFHPYKDYQTYRNAKSRYKNRKKS